MAADIVGNDTDCGTGRELLAENRELHEASRRLVEEVEAVRTHNRDLTKRLNAI